MKKKAVTPNSNHTGAWLRKAAGPKSLLLLLAGGLLLYAAVAGNEGYNWAWNSLLKGNWELTRKHAGASLDERLQMKLGFNYAYLNFVKQNTPEEAVILFPLKDNMFDKAGNMQLDGWANRKYWIARFLYPRRPLFKDEAESNPLYKAVTHVAIVAGHGYEDLDYEVKGKMPFTVLPKQQPH